MLVSSIAGSQGDTRMRNFSLPSRNQRRLAKLHLDELSAAARRRLKWFDWHREHGEDVSLTCRHFAISRQTFYRWLKRYDPFDLASLEDRPSRPHRLRPKTWTVDEVEAVRQLRERYPRWGKLKLAVLLVREGIVLSVSKVGRILSYLKARGALHEPPRRSLSRRRQWKRQYATRKPKDYVPAAPGDLVQIDTMGRDSCARRRASCSSSSRRSMSGAAGLCLPSPPMLPQSLPAAPLDDLLARAPFPIKAIQADGGPEFMADFEDACQQKGIRLFALPPRSPKLNGRVERANRTYREEFYDCSTCPPTVAGFKDDLRRWEHIYNHIRPHQALGHQTPTQFLANWHATHPQEDLSRT
jgi:transposase InsO family protein